MLVSLPQNHPSFERYSEATRLNFENFHALNPHVYEEFKELATQMWNAGRRKYSAEAIFNVIRWRHDIRTVGDTFKVNNNYRSIYARLLAVELPQFEEFFSFREIANEEAA